MSNKIYTCSDLHGQWNLYQKILNYLDETDTLIYLGDACDRGLDGIKIMQSLLSKNNIIYLLGNHERMFLNGTKINDTLDYNFEYYRNMQIWMSNGGNTTYEEYLNLNKQEQEELRKRIAQLPIYAEYINKSNQYIFLCHSGIDVEELNKLNKKENNSMISQTKLYLKDENKFIWNRDHLNTEHWNNDIQYKNTYIIHGHTPTIALHTLNPMFKENNNIEIVKYCDNHKIDIDIGSYFTDMTVLLDLDTLEPIYIK